MSRIRGISCKFTGIEDADEGIDTSGIDMFCSQISGDPVTGKFRSRDIELIGYESEQSLVTGCLINYSRWIDQSLQHSVQSLKYVFRAWEASQPHIGLFSMNSEA